MSGECLGENMFYDCFLCGCFGEGLRFFGMVWFSCGFCCGGFFGLGFLFVCLFLFLQLLSFLLKFSVGNLRRVI